VDVQGEYVGNYRPCQVSLKVAGRGRQHVPNKGLPYYEEESLVRGRASNLYVQVGTPGLGRGTFVPVPVTAIPQGLHPVAELVFPSRGAEEQPQRARVVLQGRC
jgi:hypothetical protein